MKFNRLHDKRDTFDSPFRSPIATPNYAEITNSVVVRCLFAANPLQDGRGKHLVMRT